MKIPSLTDIMLGFCPLRLLKVIELLLEHKVEALISAKRYLWCLQDHYYYLPKKANL
jgi:hypothetical protein